MDADKLMLTISTQEWEAIATAFCYHIMAMNDKIAEHYKREPMIFISKDRKHLLPNEGVLLEELYAAYRAERDKLIEQYEQQIAIMSGLFQQVKQITEQKEQGGEENASQEKQIS